jgi:hypothetical protein
MVGLSPRFNQVQPLAGGVQKTRHFLGGFALDAHGKAKSACFQVGDGAVQQLAPQVGCFFAGDGAGAVFAAPDDFDVVADAHMARLSPKPNGAACVRLGMQKLQMYRLWRVPGCSARRKTRRAKRADWTQCTRQCRQKWDICGMAHALAQTALHHALWGMQEPQLVPHCSVACSEARRSLSEPPVQAPGGFEWRGP